MASTSIASKDPRDITLGGCRLTASGIVFDRPPTFEEWEAAGAFIQRCESASAWWVGDWLLHGEGRPEWGDGYEQAISLFGKDYDTLSQYKSVAARFGPADRSVNLPWSHYLAVVSLPPANRVELLAEAEHGKLSVAAVRMRAREERAKLAPAPTLPDSTYSLIYADPQWGYDGLDVDHENGNGRMMSLEAIKAFPVETVAATHCVLLLWATVPRLYDALEVIQAWGFSYRSGLVWDRQRTAMGDYYRIRTEHLLLGTKGRPGAPLSKNRIENLIAAPRVDGRRSDVFYELIERMYPNAGRLELFAVSGRPGWESMGHKSTAVA